MSRPIEMHINISQETSEEPLHTEIYKKNAAAQIEPRTQTHTLCEPAQSNCTSTTFHKSHCMRKFTGEMPRPRLSPRTHTHTHFVRACAVDMHVNMSQDPLYTEIYRKNAGAQIEPRTQTRTLCELAQSKCSRQSKRMSRFHKSHFIRPKTTAQTLCEPAQSERMSRFHKSHFIRACAVETRVKIPQEPLYAKIYR